MKILTSLILASLINFISVGNVIQTKITKPIKCVVVFHPSQCDYFICLTENDDYLLMQWYGGNDPEKDDILIGNFNTYGFVGGYNLTKDSKFRVYVEDYWLSKETAIEKYIEHCD